MPRKATGFATNPGYCAIALRHLLFRADVGDHFAVGCSSAGLVVVRRTWRDAPAGLADLQPLQALKLFWPPDLIGLPLGTGKVT